MTFLEQFWRRTAAPLAITIVWWGPLAAQQSPPAAPAESPAATDSPAAVSPVAKRAISAAQLDRLVQPYLDADLLQAVSIGLVDGDQSWTRHYGTLSADHPQPPDDDTLYEIGSITKVFTGVLLAEAVVAGKLTLTQPIGTLLPTLQTENSAVAETIQLVHLATHTSGLPRMPNNFKPSDPQDPYADYGRDDMTEFMIGVKPEKSPGGPSGYSNLAVGLLGDLLSARADASYQQLLQQTIAKPLAMNDTTLQLNDDQSARLAPPHNADRKPDSRWRFDAMAGAGSIISSTADMVRWIQANLNPPAGPLGEAINLAWQQHSPAAGDAFAMGLGWHIARDGETRWHNGQTGGYHTMMLIDRERNLGVIVMSNTATGHVDTFAESIIQTMAGMSVQPRSFDDPKPVDAKIVARLAGKYELLPQFVLTVRADGDKLFVQATNQPELQIYPDSETHWKYRVVDAQLKFDLPDEGPAKSLKLYQSGQELTARRTGD